MGVYYGLLGVVVVLEVEVLVDFFRVVFEGEGELWGVLVLVLGRVVCVGFFYVWSGVFEEVGRCIFLFYVWGKFI